jgi:hypothetical protein
LCKLLCEFFFCVFQSNLIPIQIGITPETIAHIFGFCDKDIIHSLTSHHSTYLSNEIQWHSLNMNRMNGFQIESVNAQITNLVLMVYETYRKPIIKTGYESTEMYPIYSSDD